MEFSIEGKILGNQQGENERRDIFKSADSRKLISKSAYDESLREIVAQIGQQSQFLQELNCGKLRVT